MPTYDYQCRDCGAVTEVIHAMSEDGPTVCDACGGPLRRVLYPAGIIFKGSGFYRTDSRAAAGTAGSSTSKASGDGAKSGDAAAASTGDAGSTPTSSGSPAASSSSADSSSGGSGSGD